MENKKGNWFERHRKELWSNTMFYIVPVSLIYLSAPLILSIMAQSNPTPSTVMGVLSIGILYYYLAYFILKPADRDLRRKLAEYEKKEKPTFPSPSTSARVSEGAS